MSKLCMWPAINAWAYLNVAATINGLVKFNGLNYAEWADHIDFQLGVMNLDIAIVMEKPTTPTNESTDDDKNFF